MSAHNALQEFSCSRKKVQRMLVHVYVLGTAQQFCELHIFFLHRRISNSSSTYARD